MPASARPGSSSGSNRSCWPNRASTQAWKRVPNRAAGDGCRGIGRASSAANVVGIAPAAGPARSPTGWPAAAPPPAATARVWPRPPAARARRPTRSTTAAWTRSGSGVVGAGVEVGEHPLGRVDAAQGLGGLLGDRPRRLAHGGGAVGWAFPWPACRARLTAPRPTHPGVAHRCLVRRRAERCLPVLLPEVRRHHQRVPCAGERDVPEPELLGGLVLLGALAERLRWPTRRDPAAPAGRARRRAAASAGTPAGSARCRGSSLREAASRRRRR